eukprot:scpid28772/ scgid9436/ 
MSRRSARSSSSPYARATSSPAPGTTQARAPAQNLAPPRAPRASALPGQVPPSQSMPAGHPPQPTLASQISAAVAVAIQPLADKVTLLEQAGAAQLAGPGTGVNSGLAHVPTFSGASLCAAGSIATAAPVLPVSVPAASHPTQQWPSSGDLPVVPPRLRDRIVRGEFTELSDLLPESLGFEGDHDVMQLDVGAGRSVQLVPKSSHRQPAKRHIYDLATWVEAFTTYSRVLADASPQLAGDLWAYQAIIVDANVRFHNDAWLSYDRKFRMATASLPHRYSWSVIDPNLWQSCLTGRGRPPCQRCSMVHPSQPSSCPFRGGLPAPTAPTGSQFSHQPGFDGKAICRNFNFGSCLLSPCSRAHVCIQCRGRHPARQCSKSGDSTKK